MPEDFRYQYGSSTAEAYETRNPARPTAKVGRYGHDDDMAIAEVILRAEAAQKEWARIPGLERSVRLNAFLDAVVARADEIALAVTLEQGKLLSEAKAETLKGCAEGRFMVGEAARMGGSAVAEGRAGVSTQIIRRPRGIILCITPWNFPAMTPLRKICPAVAFGNAVILKPSPFTPAAAYLLAQIAKEYFPQNLVQVLMTDGSSTGRIISGGNIHGVSFTGSVPTGKLVYAAAAQSLVPVQLELGGKNAAILNDSEDLPGAVSQIFGAAMQTCGQRCTAISRLLIQSKLVKEVEVLLAELADAVVLGDGVKQGSQMGPLCHMAQWENVRKLTDRAIAEGAKPLAGARVPEGAGAVGGYFFRPTILSKVQPQSTGGQVEIFGPVLSLLEYESFGDAMDLLNGTPFGLTSALFSNSNHLIQRFFRESQHGMMHVNHGTIPDNNMPFGGIKASGVGAYSVGPTAVNFYTTEHSAYLAA